MVSYKLLGLVLRLVLEIAQLWGSAVIAHKASINCSASMTLVALADLATEACLRHFIKPD